MHGAHELHAGRAIGELVRHHLRDRERRDRLVERALQRLREGHGRGLRIGEEHLGLAVDLAAE